MDKRTTEGNCSLLRDAMTCITNFIRQKGEIVENIRNFPYSMAVIIFIESVLSLYLGYWLSRIISSWSTSIGLSEWLHEWMPFLLETYPQLPLAKLNTEHAMKTLLADSLNPLDGSFLGMLLPAMAATIIIASITWKLATFIWLHWKIHLIHRAKGTWIFFLGNGFLVIFGYFLFQHLNLFTNAVLSGFGSVLAIMVIAFIANPVSKHLEVIRDIDSFARPRRFAPLSASKNQDALGWDEKSETLIRTIVGNERLQRYISIIVLDGELGGGKSSFLRMAIERLFESSPRKYLYTHLSLTECNKAEDFVTLFYRRWNETLEKRYPNANGEFVRSAALLEFIFPEALRDDIVGKFSQLLRFLNLPLIRTRLKISDPYYGRVDSTVSGRIAQIFQNVPEFREDAWIFVIEDLERSTMDEALRVIETVETLRHEGREGLPIRLIFILPYSRKEIQRRLNNLPPDEKTRIVRDFLMEDTRYIDLYARLPARTYYERRDYVVREISRDDFEHWHERKVDDLKEDIKSLRFDNWEKQGASTGTGYLSELISDFLAYETPRNVRRIVDQASMESYAIVDALSEANDTHDTFVRYCDLLGIVFLKDQFPDAFEAWEQSDIVRNPILSLMERFEKIGNARNGNEGASQDVDAITNGSGKRLAAKEAEKLLRLIFGGSLDQERTDRNIAPEWTFRTFHYERARHIYFTQESKDNNKVITQYLKFLANRNHSWKDVPEDDFSSFSYLLALRSDDSHVEDMKKSSLEIIHRLGLESVNVDKETERSLVMSFWILLSKLHNIEERHETKLNSKKGLNATNILKKFFKSENVRSSAQYIILSYLLKHRSTEPEGRDFIESLNEVQIKKFGQLALSLAKKRYFGKGAEKNIYQENFPVYIAYQSWNGEWSDKNPTSEIKRLRRAMEKVDEKALRYLWNSMPMPEGPSLNNDFSEIFFTENIDGMKVYMPIKKLINYTEEHKMESDPEIAQKFAFWNRLEGLNADSAYEKWKKQPPRKQQDGTIKEAILKIGKKD